MMRAKPEWRWRFFVERLFNRQRRFAFCETGTIADTKDVCIDGKGFRTKGGIHHNIGRLAPDTGKFFQKVAVRRNVSAMVADQYL